MFPNLINNLKKAIELYLLNEAPENQIIDELEFCLRLNLKEGTEDDESFLQELSFFKSTSTSEGSKFATSEVNNITSIRQWISSCIDSKCLRHSIQTLLGDNEFLEKYYEVNCFIHKENLTPLFICLLAFELKQSSLLSQIENVISDTGKVKHKRTSSHPHFSRVSVSTPSKECQEEKVNFHTNHTLTAFKSWKSLPNVQAITKSQLFSRDRSKTFSESIQMHSNHSSANDEVDNDCIELISTEDIKIWQDISFQRQPSEAKDIPKQSLPPTNSRIHTSPLSSFLSSIFGSPLGGSYSCQDNSSGTSSEGGACKAIQTFLQTTQGEKIRSRNLFDDCEEEEFYGIEMNPDLDTNTNLTALLQSARHSSRKNTDLEKENAHFNVSEAIISAIEHIKWEHFEQANEALSTTCSKDKIMRGLQVTGNEHIVYAELDETLTAEKVGLTLISRFNEKQLPKYSELKWLVSDGDVPQEMLPMPENNDSRNPDDYIVHHCTRGTRYWAPPRQQIIFTEHEQENRKTVIHRQNYRCAGCGMRISPNYMKSFRYCSYLGKYHCTGCHRNQVSIIPAKVLKSWDFKAYQVSCFSYRLLQQIWLYPLFHLPSLNSELYSKVKNLEEARQKRVNLKFAKDLIMMCRFAEREQDLIGSLESYIAFDPDTWSMADFVQTRKRDFQKKLEAVISTCEDHAERCLLCSARGFTCEICQNDEIFFPWQPKVFRCELCGQCYHKVCWEKTHFCVKCQRLRKRDLEKQLIPKNNREFFSYS